MLRITAGGFSFTARLEEEDAPETVAAFRRLLPLESRIIHVRWSGEAGWIPFGDLDLGLGPENATCYPHPGRDRPLPGRRLGDGDPARLRLRQLRLEGRRARGQPLRDDRRGQREPASAGEEVPLGGRAGDRVRGGVSGDGREPEASPAAAGRPGEAEPRRLLLDEVELHRLRGTPRSPRPAAAARRRRRGPPRRSPAVSSFTYISMKRSATASSMPRPNWSAYSSASSRFSSPQRIASASTSERSSMRSMSRRATLTPSGSGSPVSSSHHSPRSSTLCSPTSANVSWPSWIRSP